uniref:(northern house mosquito) hypothetical protein n=1 Tax=Culex pipiens TaxID=7175 RepID=A0A8D7ZTX8_CULPI
MSHPTPPYAASGVSRDRTELPAMVVAIIWKFEPNLGASTPPLICVNSYTRQRYIEAQLVQIHKMYSQAGHHRYHGASSLPELPHWRSNSITWRGFDLNFVFYVGLNLT